jgi:RNA-directed DNA polymerase
VKTQLLGIAEKARREKKHRFSDLYRMLNEELLRDCWRDLNKRAATGVDRISAEEYGVNLEVNIKNLVTRLKEKRYRANLIRRHYIPKGEGKLRPLGIPVVEEKLLQMAVTRVLEAIYEQDFLPCSFGYRPGVSAHDAVNCMAVKLQFGKYKHIVEADIKGYFNNIDHDRLVKMLKLRIDDDPFLRLIQKWLKAGVLEIDGKVIHPGKGSPQGGSVSPILANIYLHYCLDLWVEKVVKKECRGQVRLIRYVDDWLCAFEYQSEAESFYTAVRERLKKFGLELAEEKSGITAFSRFHGRRASVEFLGFEFRWGKDRKGKAHLKRRTAPKRFTKSLKALTAWCKANRNLKVSELAKKFKSKLQGYCNYFGIECNAASVGRYYFLATATLYKWLNRRSERRSYNFKGFNELLDHFGIKLPGIRSRPRKLYV